MTKFLTQLEFAGDDFERAERRAAALGYSQTAYTSSSSLIGLFCLPDYLGHHAGCIIKTVEFGFMFVQTMEDIGLPD